MSFCASLLQSLGQSGQVLSIVFVNRQEMHGINLRYREKDYPTDVLSFAYEGVRMEGDPFLGEIIIAPQVALENAVRSGTSPERELRKLLVHGTLHLLGYDHEKDKGEMNRLQAKLLQRKYFFQPPPLARLRGAR